MCDRCARLLDGYTRIQRSRNGSSRAEVVARLSADLIEARDLLAPVYSWFTEGFDTPVLQEAKALLEQLEA